MPADVVLASDVRGVGDPPTRVQLVRQGGLAALVSTMDLTRGLGTPEEAVAGALLAVHQEAFAAALKQFEGRAQYVLKGRYVEQVVLSEALEEIPEAARLREQIRGNEPAATRQARIRLGEIINKAVTAKRAADTRALREVAASCCVAGVVREPTHELDAVHLALLVETSRQDDLEQALSDLASDWEGRIGIRLLGPMAPYDFTTTPVIADYARP